MFGVALRTVHRLLFGLHLRWSHVRDGRGSGGGAVQRGVRGTWQGGAQRSSRWKQLELEKNTLRLGRRRVVGRGKRPAFEWEAIEMERGQVQKHSVVDDAWLVIDGWLGPVLELQEGI